MGTAGDSTGIHLHFGIKTNSTAWNNGEYVDPMPYLEDKIQIPNKTDNAGGIEVKGKYIKEIEYDDIKIMLDGKETVLTDLEGIAIEPFLINNTMYVPISPLVRKFGKTSTYESSKKTLVIK